MAVDKYYHSSELRLIHKPESIIIHIFLLEGPFQDCDFVGALLKHHREISVMGISLF